MTHQELVNRAWKMDDDELEQTIYEMIRDSKDTIWELSKKIIEVITEKVKDEWR